MEDDDDDVKEDDDNGDGEHFGDGDDQEAVEVVMVLPPVPKLSSPQRAIRPASSRVPKYFHPVGVSKHSKPRASATLIKNRLKGQKEML